MENMCQLFSCGQGEVGQLGLGTNILEKTGPTFVSANIISCEAGGMHSICLTSTGDVLSFGCNDEHALGRDTTEDGSEFILKKVYLPERAVKITAGDSHSACLLNDGRVFVWGSFRDSYGNMGITKEETKQYPFQILCHIKSKDIVSGNNHLVILSENGQVYTLGCGEQGQLGRVSDRSSSRKSRQGNKVLLKPDFVYIKTKPAIADKIWATSYSTFMRQRYTGDIYVFGLNNYNQLPTKSSKLVEFFPKQTYLSRIIKIAGK